MIAASGLLTEDNLTMESVSLLHVLLHEGYQHFQAPFGSCCGLILSLYNIVALLESCVENDTQAMLYCCVCVLDVCD